MCLIALLLYEIFKLLYHSFETLLLLNFFYLMVKSVKSFVKIGSRFQIALLFLFYRNFYAPPATYSYPPPRPLIWFYLMLQISPPSPLIRTLITNSLFSIFSSHHRVFSFIFRKINLISFIYGQSMLRSWKSIGAHTSKQDS